MAAYNHSFAQQLMVRKVQENVYESVENPVRMGNVMPIAYGGCTIGVALAAAVQTTLPTMHAYSALGHYLGPAPIDRKLICLVERLRDTKTFATRRVTVQHVLDDGQARTCLTVTVDFHAEEPANMRYGIRPSREWSGPDAASTHREVFDSLVTEGALKKADWDQFANGFLPILTWWDSKHCLEGVSGQNLNGLAKRVWTTMDHLDITEKISTDWSRTREPLPAELQLAALGFHLDGGLSFLPLSHDHMFLEDAGACSSLDFALRIFTPNLKLDEWHLRERQTFVGDAGRTYSEGKLFDVNGKFVASMTQQSIMRPKPKPKPKIIASL